MESIIVKNNTYEYLSNYRNDDEVRHSYNQLVQKIYGFDFEAWYQNGYWGEKYIPYSLLDKEVMVSNVSVSVIDFLVFGEKRTYIQIGTVMTDPHYRNNGLNKALMGKVLDEWRGKCDLIYLFANNSVLDFYPKFGFIPVIEYQHSKTITSAKNNVDFVVLNVKSEEGKNLLLQKIDTAIPQSNISMLENRSLLMFYFSSFMADSIYYIPSLEAIVAAEYKQETLVIIDVFCSEKVDLDDIVFKVANDEITRVVFGFTPLDCSSLEENVHTPDDVLFILDDKWGTFDHAKVRFPVLSHA